MSDVGAPRSWRSPEELLEVAFASADIVLVNEAHHGLLRCVRTREVGLRLIRHADALGVRLLAMEALHPADIAQRANYERKLPPFTRGYLAQPEMRAMVNEALSRGWTLLPYEADIQRGPAFLNPRGEAATSWREREQANNIASRVRELDNTARVLVWCGNHHLALSQVDDWRPMAVSLRDEFGIQVFSLDQTPSVEFGDRPPVGRPWVSAFRSDLADRGGNAGFLRGEAPIGWPWDNVADAFLLSIYNDLI